MISLTRDECQALVEIMNQLSGGNAEYAFVENLGTGESSDPKAPECTGPAKIFIGAGRSRVVPKVLGGDR